MSTSPPPPGIPSTATDLDLLRAFEPVVRYTAGEQFFPMDVERYVAACSLWLYHPDDRDELIVPEGELTMESLIEHRAADFGSIFYLRFVPRSRSRAARGRLPTSSGSSGRRGRHSRRASDAWPAAASCLGSATRSSRVRFSCAARCRARRPPLQS
jgi:hypothetical protein